MKNIQVLDCTLRDGGRIINCEFEDTVISELTSNLTKAGIDIVEVGFLRGTDLVEYSGNSTFFTNVEQIKPFIPKSKISTTYVAFIDYKMYDFAKLEKCDGLSITGIRVGFTKAQFDMERDQIKKNLLRVKEQGYKLFIQGVNSLSYTDKELLELIDLVNEVEPYSFGLVDTYGAMYLDDITHYYNVIDYNLDQKICIDIHSHNNFQLSFAFAQQIIMLASSGQRKIILDATLNGMGKCAGNLNTELIADFLIRKKNYDYDMNTILDIIDRYLYPLKKTCEWGYSIPAFMAGIYKAHPNNIIYLTEKYRLNSKDIKYIISCIDEKKRQGYDYDNIQKIYKDYCQCRVDDSEIIGKLQEEFKGKKVLVLAPGKSIETYHDEIGKFIQDNEVLVISVNFMPKNFKYDYLFYANTIHWEKISGYIDRTQCILTSNIHVATEETMMVDYTSLIVEDSFLCDNSTIMLLNLMKRLNVTEIVLAGFDGLKHNEENYVDATFPDDKKNNSIDEINNEVKRIFHQLKNKSKDKIKFSFITPSIY